MPHSRSVYIVDDDEDIRIALEALLDSIGFQVTTFSSAEEFLSRVDLDKPGCLVLDVRLTGQSGIALQNHLNRMGNEIPIIFISGHGDIPMAVKAIKAGAAEFLTKPVRPQDLIDAIHAALESDSQRRARFAATNASQRLYNGLTPREKDVMSLIVAGHGNKQTAILLGISEPTVKAHRGQVMKKLNMQSLPDLVRFARELDVEGPSKA
ncbi:response regulator transcription factor [Sinorhizobium mexicanum]|uniref:Response regulator transcription factor n=1 Tax=Sinorhizobium mexicanum TaxID=375549 RepID=A0A859QW86_9HYPH|nr:response regulator [Sinorhizobium mexicanum]MBP1881826.1 FixJ family two-component response regulator [Sinorhizobium mexicanum]QLL61578.1 response regulator transcription factor [Sinorhizobium mexicanum]